MISDIENVIENAALPKGARQAVPVCMRHGTNDTLVRYPWAKSSAEKIRNMGWDVDFRGYK